MDRLGRLRRPAYTGANRCWPCTAVNAVLVAVVAALFAVTEPLLGALVAIGGLAAIALRGYVVPYTPRVAPHLVAALPGGSHLFPDHDATQYPPGDDADRTAGGLGDVEADGERVLAELTDAGVLVGESELAIAPDVATDWTDAMQSLASLSTEELASAAADAAPHPASARAFEDTGRSWVILTDDEESLASETWLTRAVAIADVGVVRTLTARGVAPDTAADAAAPLRLFLDECPDCGGVVDETTARDCCGGFGPEGPTPVLACTDCRQRLATLDRPASG